jgi:hypothetical protein
MKRLAEERCTVAGPAAVGDQEVTLERKPGAEAAGWTGWEPTVWRQAGHCRTDSTRGRPGETQLDWRVTTSSLPQRVQMVAARPQPGQKATWVMP